MADVDNWYYSNKVKDHFFNPKNFLVAEPKKGEFDAEGEVGSVVCGDLMKMWIKVEPKTDWIKDIKWRTWGCATAIASTSAFSEMVLKNGGMKIDDALKITPQDIVKHLSGLPPRKAHCSVLADQAFRKAVENYRKKKKVDIKS
jgi:NifU-like protein involved in Fe-S cluster formation